MVEPEPTETVGQVVIESTAGPEEEDSTRTSDTADAPVGVSPVLIRRLLTITAVQVRQSPGEVQVMVGDKVRVVDETRPNVALTGQGIAQEGPVSPRGDALGDPKNFSVFSRRATARKTESLLII